MPRAPLPSRAAADPGAGIAAFCVGVMEAAWLAAVIAVPLFFNPHAMQGFQPNKSVLLRVLALICAAAAATHFSLRFWPESKAARAVSPPLPRVLKLVLAAMGLSYLLATAFSLFPAVSFWGADLDMEGTVNFPAYLVIFGAIAAHLRERAQLDRLLTAIIAAAFPVALYGVVQHAGLDPRTPRDAAYRVDSTMGNAIYLAEYLGLVIPLVVWRLVRLGEALRSPASRTPPRLIEAAMHLVILLAALAAFVWTGSRGPLLGLMAGLGYLTLAWTLFRRRWRWLLVEAGVGIAVVLLFVVLNFASHSSDPKDSRSALGRLVQTLPMHGVHDERVDIWRQIPAIMLAREPLPFPAGGADALHLLRPWVGYGPDTLENVLPHMWTFPATTSNQADIQFRCHNVVWDYWFGFGFLGVISFLALVPVLFYLGYARLGLVSGAARRGLFAAVAAGGAMAGLAGFAIVSGAGFAGLGATLGLAAGVGLFPLIAMRAREENAEAADAGLILALLAALLGYVVALGFGFAVPATSLVFWVFAAVLVVVGRDGALTESPIEHRAKKRTGFRSIAAASFGPALILVVMAFAFVSLLFAKPLGMGEVLAASLTQIRGDLGPSYFLFLVAAPTALVAAYLFHATSRTRPTLGSSAAVLGEAVFVAVIYACAKAGQLSLIGPIPDAHAEAADAVRQGWFYPLVYVTFLLVLAVLVLVGGYLLSPRARLAEMLRSRAGWTLIGLLLAVLPLAWIGGVQVMCVDVVKQWGVSLATFGQTNQGLAVLHRAAEQRPSAGTDRLIAEFLINDVGSGAASPGRLAEAETALLEGRALHAELDPSDSDLGDVYLLLALTAADPAEKARAAGEAETALGRALVFEPGFAPVWTKRAMAETLLQRPQEAERSGEQAWSLMRGKNQLDWGDFYRQAGASTVLPELRRQYTLLAARCYDETVIAAESDPARAAHFRAGLAAVDLTLGRPDKALPLFLKALPDLPPAEAWQSEAVTALLYRQMGDLPNALAHLNKAIDEAPASQRPRLMAMRQQMARQ